MKTATAKALVVENLTVGYQNGDRMLKVLDDVSFEVGGGEFVAIVGESGCGKSMTCLALSRLLPDPLRILSGSATLGQDDLATADEARLRQMRGFDFSMIFQDPLSSLNPTMKVGQQIVEPLLIHKQASKQEARDRAITLLETVGFRDAAAIVHCFPHELSGGMRQRVAIAAALACVPKLLIADEPTSALDATVQSHVLGLLKKFQKEFELAVMFVTHDLRLVSHVADRVVVMYAGRVVESGPTSTVLTNPKHAYTRDLLACTTTVAISEGRRLSKIRGAVPDLANLPTGCAYNPRCKLATEVCRTQVPARDQLDQHDWFCHHPEGNLALPTAGGR